MKKILIDIDDLCSDMMGNGIHAIKEFRLGFTYGAFNIISDSAIQQIRELYPNIELTISHFPDKLCEEKVKNGELDLACSSGPIQDPALCSVPFIQSPLYLFMHKTHRLAKLHDLSLQDLKGESFYYVSGDFRVLDDFLDACKAYNFDPIISYTTPDTSYINDQVSKNKGVSVIPECLINSIKNPELVFKEFPLENCRWELYLIFARNVQHSRFEKDMTQRVFGVRIS